MVLQPTADVSDVKSAVFLLFFAGNCQSNTFPCEGMMSR